MIPKNYTQNVIPEYQVQKFKKCQTITKYVLHTRTDDDCIMPQCAEQAWDSDEFF